MRSCVRRHVQVMYVFTGALLDTCSGARVSTLPPGRKSTPTHTHMTHISVSQRACLVTTYHHMAQVTASTAWHHSTETAGNRARVFRVAGENSTTSR